MAFLDSWFRLRESPHHLQMLILFIGSSFVAIFATTLVLSTVLANYMTSQTTMRDAVVSMEFVNSMVRAENANEYFSGENTNTDVPELEGFFVHLARLPDVFRANVYAQSGKILWSSHPGLVGRSFEQNHELETAMSGKLHPELVIANRDEKEEHVGLPEGVDRFIEYYLPIWSLDRMTVVGAVEIYKSPINLLGSISRLSKMAWTGAGIAGTLLFSALLLVVAYSTKVLRRQEQRLVETEKLAVVGEMASAVAHGLRNPLAAIRSCAELVAEDPIPDSSRGTITDIIDQVDRLEGWIRSFLIHNQTDSPTTGEFARVDQVVQRCIDNFTPQMQKRNIKLEMSASNGIAVAFSSSAQLEQLLNSIISNAIEAMKTGGTLGISWGLLDDGHVSIQVCDTGPGISDSSMTQVFVPFQTSKSSGLGVGLALGRRIAERLGGHLNLRNLDTTGVEVTLNLPGRG